MGFLDSIKKFAVESPASDKTEENKPHLPPPIQAFTYNTITPAPTNNPPSVVMPSDQVRAKLIEKINKSAQPNYLKFQEMHDKMKGVMDSRAAYQAAAIATGMTKAEFTGAIDALLSRLEQEDLSYGKVIESNSRDQIDAKNGIIKGLREKIAEERHQIEVLQQQIIADEGTINTVQNEIGESTTSINSASAIFKATVARVRADLERSKQEAAIQLN